MLENVELKKKVIFTNSNYITVDKVRYDFNNELILKKRRMTTVYVVNLIIAVLFSLLIIDKFGVSAIFLQLIIFGFFLLLFHYLYYIIASFMLPSSIKEYLIKHHL
ncbi:MAG: hypothetical protein RSB19_06120 [Erysipelotrichaceae bacterium]